MAALLYWVPGVGFSSWKLLSSLLLPCLVPFPSTSICRSDYKSHGLVMAAWVDQGIGALSVAG